MGIKEFAQKFAEDKDFATKYLALESLDALFAQAKKDGYSIAREEFEAALQKAESGELSDEKLDVAAGGLSYIPSGGINPEQVRNFARLFNDSVKRDWF